MWFVTVLAVAGKATIGKMLVSMLISGRTDHFWLLGTYDNPTTDQHKPINLQTCYGKLLRRFKKWCIIEALDISLCHITCFAEYCCECGSFPILSWTPFSGRRWGYLIGARARGMTKPISERPLCVMVTNYAKGHIWCILERLCCIGKPGSFPPSYAEREGAVAWPTHKEEKNET